MNKINRIIADPDYRHYLENNKSEEKNRLFCTHHFEHLLAVARLTYILLLEAHVPFISREIAYATGLLHDIGRWQEYQSGRNHAACSAELAGPILKAAGFSEAEQKLIQKAIIQHRPGDDQITHRSPLSKALKEADQLSRLCFRCAERSNCRKFENQPHKEKLAY